MVLCSFRVTIFLFKVLAVLDNMFLSLYNIWFYVDSDENDKSYLDRVARGLTHGIGTAIVYMTLLLVFCRFVQVCSLFFIFILFFFFFAARLSFCVGQFLFL
jgi:hypothetical protein